MSKYWKKHTFSWWLYRHNFKILNLANSEWIFGHLPLHYYI